MSVEDSFIMHEKWLGDTRDIAAAVEPLIEYGEDGRSHGWVYSRRKYDWPEALFRLGPWLIDELYETVGLVFDSVSFQAYRDGDAWQDWHYDACDVQAVLSIGATRIMGIRERTIRRVERLIPLEDGDLLVEPFGTQDSYEHCLTPCAGSQERVALVFRTGSPYE